MLTVTEPGVAWDEARERKKKAKDRRQREGNIFFGSQLSQEIKVLGGSERDDGNNDGSDDGESQTNDCRCCKNKKSRYVEGRVP